MDHFAVKPASLGQISAEINAAGIRLQQEMDEVSAVIRQLRQMTGFERPLEGLKRLHDSGEELAEKTLSSSRVLNRIQEMYRTCESRNSLSVTCAGFSMPPQLTARLYFPAAEENAQTAPGWTLAEGTDYTVQEVSMLPPEILNSAGLQCGPAN